jgi:hypothetical protein
VHCYAAARRRCVQASRPGARHRPRCRRTQNASAMPPRSGCESCAGPGSRLLVENKPIRSKTINQRTAHVFGKGHEFPIGRRLSRHHQRRRRPALNHVPIKSFLRHDCRLRFASGSCRDRIQFSRKDFTRENFKNVRQDWLCEGSQDCAADLYKLGQLCGLHLRVSHGSQDVFPSISPWSRSCGPVHWGRYCRVS